MCEIVPCLEIIVNSYLYILRIKAIRLSRTYDIVFEAIIISNKRYSIAYVKNNDIFIWNVTFEFDRINIMRDVI